MSKLDKSYSVKDQDDGLTIKERYTQFRRETEKVISDIEKHDPKMANSARTLLSVQKDS